MPCRHRYSPTSGGPARRTAQRRGSRVSRTRRPARDAGTRSADAAGDGAGSAYWAGSEADLLLALGSAPEGLSAREAHARLRRAGAIAPHRHRTQLVLLLRQFANPITLILVFATAVAAVLGD